MAFREFIDALQAGKQLENSADWKNMQKTGGNVVALLGGILALLSLFGFHPQVTPEQLVGVAGGIAAVLGVCNTYLTVATTDKIGLAGKVPSGGGVPDAAKAGDGTKPDAGPIP